MTQIITQKPKVSTLNLSPYFDKSGKPLMCLSGENKGKVILVDGLTLTELHDGLRPQDLTNYVNDQNKVGNQRMIQFSYIDPRTYEKWSDLLNEERNNRYNNVYEAMSRNGLIERPSELDKTSLRVRYNVIQTDSDDLPNGDFAPMSDRMSDLKLPISLVGATGDIFAHYIYRYGVIHWIRDQFTSEQQYLLRIMMIHVMRQRQKVTFNGVKNRFDGLIPPTDPTKEKIHGTKRIDLTVPLQAALLGSFTAGAWENGTDLKSAKKVVTAAIRYMRRPVLPDPSDPDSGQDLLGGRFILFLGSGLYDWIGEDVLDDADRLETSLMARLMQIPQIIEVVEATDLPRGSFQLVNADMEHTSVIEAVPMTTSMSQEPLVGHDLQMVLYLLMSMKVIATSDYKKNNIIVDNA